MVTPGSPDDATLAADLATKAGELLLALREEMASADPKDLRHAGDNRSQALLAQLLGESRPHDAVLSEEAEDDRVRLEADRVWIIDPLDGTREYGEPPRDDWAVHVALWERSGGLTTGAVALPAQGRTLATGSALPTRGPAPSRPRLVVSRTRAPEFVTAVADRLNGELVPMGSAGAKAMAVLRGEAVAYVHAGGQWEWDSAAPVGVVLAAGLHASRIDGSPLVYNQADVSLPDLIVCRPELAEAVLAVTAG
jgi:3'(2'), 5'-bisphosphate nucleotidase